MADPLSVIGTVYGALDLLSTAKQNFNVLAEFRSATHEVPSWMLGLSHEAEDIARLIANIEAFLRDYKDRAIDHKTAEFKFMYIKVAPFLETLPSLSWTNPGPVELMTVQSATIIIPEFHQRLKVWVSEVVDSPIHGMIGELKDSPTECNEYTLSTWYRGQRSVREYDEDKVANVDDLVGWVFYKLFQKWSSCQSSENQDVPEVARMSILFWDFAGISTLVKLFGFTLQRAFLEELAAHLQRPACSLKIWKKQFGSSEIEDEAVERGAGKRFLLRLKTSLRRKRRTQHLRERSTARRPFVQNEDFYGVFEPGETTFVLYHAPIALSRNEEDWSLLGAVCPQRKRAVALVSNNSYFSKTPEDLQTIKDITFFNKEDVEIGPFLILLEMIKMLTKKDALEVTRHAANVYDIERRLRLFLPDDSSHSSTGIEIDFPFVTSTLSSAISRLSFHQMRLEGNLRAIKGLTTQVPGHCDCNNRHISFLPSCEEVGDSIENWLTDVKFNIEIARVQLQVANAMISQRDARESVRLTESSMRIAEAAKSDSSIMKMLSVLGACFLPGTFVSALFSMGIFNWHPDPGEPVVSSYFWIYWVITAPLTLIVAGLAVTYISRKSPTSREKKLGFSVPQIKQPTVFQGNRARTWNARDGPSDRHGSVVHRVSSARAQQGSDVELASI